MVRAPILFLVALFLFGCGARRERTVWVEKVSVEYRSGIFGGWVTVYETPNGNIETRGSDHEIAAPCSVTFSWYGN